MSVRKDGRVAVECARFLMLFQREAEDALRTANALRKQTPMWPEIRSRFNLDPIKQVDIRTITRAGMILFLFAFFLFFLQTLRTLGGTKGLDRSMRRLPIVIPRFHGKLELATSERANATRRARSLEPFRNLTFCEVSAGVEDRRHRRIVTTGGAAIVASECKASRQSLDREMKGRNRQEEKEEERKREKYEESEREERGGCCNRRLVQSMTAMALSFRVLQQFPCLLPPTSAQIKYRVRIGKSRKERGRGRRGDTRGRFAAVRTTFFAILSPSTYYNFLRFLFTRCARPTKHRAPNDTLVKERNCICFTSLLRATEIISDQRRCLSVIFPSRDAKFALRISND